MARRLGWNNTNDGVFGGGTVGYNYQTGSFVFGVEADFGGAGLTGNWNNGIAAGTVGNFWAKNDANFYADVTGRLGYAAGPALFYVKGGWAYLDTNLSVGGVDCLTAPHGRGALTGLTVGSSAAASNICSPRLGASRPNTCTSISAGTTRIGLTQPDLIWQLRSRPYRQLLQGRHQLPHQQRVRSSEVGVCPILTSEVARKSGSLCCQDKRASVFFA